MSNVPVVTITVTLPQATVEALRRYTIETNMNRDNAIFAMVSDGLDVQALLHPRIGVRVGVEPHPMSSAAKLMRAGAKGFATGERG